MESESSHVDQWFEENNGSSTISPQQRYISATDKCIITESNRGKRVLEKLGNNG